MTTTPAAPEPVASDTPEQDNPIDPLLPDPDEANAKTAEPDRDDSPTGRADPTDIVAVTE